MGARSLQPQKAALVEAEAQKILARDNVRDAAVSDHPYALDPWVTNKRAISSSSVSSLTVITGADMTASAEWF